MRLNTETLEAIRNRRYQLRPVRATAPFSQKTRRLSGSEVGLQMNHRRSFHNHGEGHYYQGLLLVESAY